MVEFKCICGGRILELLKMRNKQQGKWAEVAFFGCLRCHRVYFGAPEVSLSQEAVDKGFPISVG